jgi:hypothetical protein
MGVANVTMRTRSIRSRALLAVASLLALLLVGCSEEAPGPPEIPYGFDGIDLARLEYEKPLTPPDLMKITPENIQQLSQEQIDQIYARLTAGPIPDGPFDGDLFFPGGMEKGKSRFAEIIGGRLRAHEFAPEDHSAFDGVRNRVKRRIADFKVGQLENLGRALWTGKVFYRDDDSTSRPFALLRNRIESKALVRILLAGKDADIIEREGAREDLFFPAKVYCGQSLLDGRRESIIIDYAFSDEQEGYIEALDRLGGRSGLQIRDEIRMVRPGFYLGRAYLARAFALNFTLYNEQAAGNPGQAFERGETVEDCWEGPQRIAARTARLASVGAGAPPP